MPPQDPDLQKEIDEIRNFPSDRPTPVEIHFDNRGPRTSLIKSLRPKIPDSWPARVVAIMTAGAAIAEVIHQLVSHW